MVQNEQLGMFVVVSSAFAVTTSLVLGRMVAIAELPLWSIVSMGDGLALIVFGLGIAWLRPPLPRHREAMWVILRTNFRTIGFVAAQVAVQVGASPGDIAALTSINTVVAAMMGHYFLREKMRLVHVSALVCTVAGALLITQPAFLFGGDRAASPYLGYALALASGFMKAGDFIAARKTPEVSALVGSFCSVGFALVFYVCFAAFAGESRLLGALRFELWTLVPVVLSCFIIDFIAIATSTVGSVMCPAAVSATLYTGSSIVFGYFAQALLFNILPGPFTIAGATLILIAVGIMSATRVQPLELTADHSLGSRAFNVVSDTVSVASTASAATTVRSASTVSTMTNMVYEDETESLASIVSFMAKEFAVVLPDSETETMRLRRSTGQGGTKQFAQTLGVIAAVAVATV